MQSCTCAFGHLCDVKSVSRYNSLTIFSDYAHFCLPVKEKEKQRRIKGLTMVQWINHNRINRSVLVLAH